ncbi:UDP-N-acetylglucosamine1-carboxyvinyltransferase [Desulfofarcimen acetoxidans DSM 771]|uniref:UDP-N-acetylglucosamine 1-carboxyvinyltransferase n=1 Tax=Desulfofarcimen acetoxidans (strain ATCC 49208 / DSM 771 / KCTC 5769 / VKM B-1644 / 5575) TaxID=485916 RepID=C8VVH0_DESAS|nr:UDP-N-acetylglucosamine 1-carboxyvinyltransferase [Desulfofarcimen acetoxidans]ACV61035.1 UDP-N-acetylglucosamine1-carboxyvinyltransferase [Desulfofarcimen acetoxidans DSM 771]
MSNIAIVGGQRLQGKVKVSGAKNATLAILGAALLANESIILENVPDISDVRIMVNIIRDLGGEIDWLDKEVISFVPPKEIKKSPIYNNVKKLRASNLLLGPLLAKFGYAEVALPGGCNIGVRPMDLHFKGLAGLGADLYIERGCVKGSAKKLAGARIYLDFPSVGATENIMMAACLAEGQTIIENVAKEPEIVDLANFLNSLGGKVRGAGTDVIKIEGVKSLDRGGRYAVIPDRIEAGTFMVAIAATRGDAILEGVIPRHIEPLIAKLREANVEITEEGDNLRVRAVSQLNPIDIKTLPYPGFPTDMQSQVMTLLTNVPGTSIIIENIFENRFQISDELKRMGAQIKVEGRMAVIEGVASLQGTVVKASDLRAGAALVIAGLMAEGVTEIINSFYIDRGYQDLEDKLSSLGAKIWRND